jgi:hypothetical protein
MKTVSFFIALLLLANCALLAQVSINTDNSTPDVSAMLDVKSTIKGFLPPRMTTTQRKCDYFTGSRSYHLQYHQKL